MDEDSCCWCWNCKHEYVWAKRMANGYETACGPEKRVPGPDEAEIPHVSSRRILRSCGRCSQESRTQTPATVAAPAAAIIDAPACYCRIYIYVHVSVSLSVYQTHEHGYTQTHTRAHIHTLMKTSLYVVVPALLRVRVVPTETLRD